ncbi:MAG: hypothetical protein IPP97_22940 [Candidatus Obscuribacter sp.]|nr:hypothetical protein [Candidatus Obscuribacter sp.]MBL0188589.1 hypothetical protein [Candidatus Obscuribacter sp.]MBP6350877.1 hypothetical protein [Candidatus Obscuribacter sp.]MBP6594335.1 hypothetical protein [Candidatus Obscuribacter sp.]
MYLKTNLVAIISLFLLSTGSAFAGESIAPSDMLEGSGFIEKMVQRADAYNDYTFEYQMVAFKKGKVVEEGAFYYKKPRLIKLIEKGNFHKGSIAILGANGKVRAKPGGALSFLAIDLAPNSNLLRSANGYPMCDSDLYSLAKALKIFLKQGNVARVSKEPVIYGTNTDKVHLLEVFHDSDMKDIFKRVAVNPQTMLPVEWWDYENGKLVSHSTWKSFKGNIGLTEDAFTFKGEKQI